MTIPQIGDGFDAGNVALHFEGVQRGVRKQRAGEQQADDNGVDDPAALRAEPLIFSELETSALQAAENIANQIEMIIVFAGSISDEVYQ